jgi:hypothetical protein
MKKLMQILMLLLVLFPIAGYCGDWELMDNPLSNTGVTLDSIWGSGNDDVYVVGGNVILHFNGRQWRIQSRTLRDFAGVWGSSRHNIYVGGTDIIGQSCGFGYWFFRPQLDLSNYCFVTRVGGIRRDMLMTGYCYDKGLSSSGGFIIRYSRLWGPRRVGKSKPTAEYQGMVTLDLPQYGYDGTIYDFWTYDNAAYCVAGDSGMLKYDGRWLSSIPIDTKGINAIWGSDLENVFLVGDAGKVLRCNIKADPPISNREIIDTEYDLYDVWGTSPTDVYVLDGWIHHYDGKTWSQMDSGGVVVTTVRGVPGGDVFAVGPNGTILRKIKSTVN